jgi:surface protein
MFNACDKLTSLNLSNWGTGNVKNMANMFASCTALSSLKLPANVNAVTDMSKMFYQCRELTVLDLSAWDITKTDGTKINMNQMFYMGDKNNVGKLKTIYVGEKWDQTYIGSSSNMFFNADKLPNYNASVVDKTNAHAGEGGYLTKK